MGKTLSALATSLVSLIMALSLAACGDSEKIGTQQSIDPSSENGSKLKLVLKAGARQLYIHFSNLDKKALDEQSHVILNALKADGIAIEKHVINAPPSGPLYVSFSTERDVTVSINKANLDSIQIESSGGTMATWDKGQSALQYKTNN